jgi:hypothetical protein
LHRWDLRRAAKRERIVARGNASSVPRNLPNFSRSYAENLPGILERLMVWRVFSPSISYQGETTC